MLIMVFIYIAIHIHMLSHLMKTINILYSCYSFYYYILIPAIIYYFQLSFTISHYRLLYYIYSKLLPFL